MPKPTGTAPNLNTISMLADGKTASIQIYSPITGSFWVDGVTSKSFSEALADLGDVAVLHIYFNTPGGSVFEGMAIYNTLNRHPAKKIGHVDALAASMGSIILMACDEINVAENAIVMIHNVRAGIEGEPNELRAMADKLDKLNANAIAIYASRSGMAPEAVAEAMDVETWYSAAEAVEAGFANAVTPNKRIVASCDVSQFSNVPDWVSATMQADPPQTKANEVTTEELEAKATAEAEAKATAEAEVKATLEAAVAAGIKAERERQTEIHALCKRAGSPEMAGGFCEDENCSVADAQAKLFSVLCEKNKPVGDGDSDPAGLAGSGTADHGENSNYVAEFTAEPAYARQMTQEEYIAMRRIDDGVDVLKLPGT